MTLILLKERLVKHSFDVTLGNFLETVDIRASQREVVGQNVRLVTLAHAVDVEGMPATV